MNSHTSLLESLATIASYTMNLDLNGVQVVFFGRLASLQTIIQFIGARVSDDNVLQALATKLGNIAINLKMERLEWPFAAEDEQEIAAAIIHIESQLNGAEPEPISLSVTTREGAPDQSLTARVATYASGSSVHFNVDHTVTGDIDGSFFSNNNIHFDADPSVRQGVDTLVEHAIDTDKSKKRQQFLNWISKLDFEATQNETFAKHTAGTGDWFLRHQDFVDWKDGKTRFLWCPGIPGAGKTILSSIIVEHLRSAILQPKIAVICIYCDYKRQEEQTPTQLLGIILKQLVQQHSSISDHLVMLHKMGVCPSIAELFAALQTEVLLYSQVYIVVDALDECSESNQARELFFSSHSQGLWSLPDHVHLLITSRDIPSISQELGSTPRIPIEAHNEDLETYIRGRIITNNKLKRLVKEDMKLAAEIVDQIILKAAGMFLQAHLHLDALASQLSRKGLRTALALLPKGIMDSYDDAMARIRSQGEAEYELACQIFYWLAYAHRPLYIEELQHAIAVSQDMTEMDFDAIVDVDVLTDVCAGLIAIQKKTSNHSRHSSNPQQIIQLVHYTTQEYFQLRQKNLFPDIHSSMAITCLTYLSFNTFNSTDISADTQKQYPLYHYAVWCWATHAKKAQNEKTTIVQHLLEFLKKENNVAYAANQAHWPTMKAGHILARFGLDKVLEQLLSQDPTHATSIDTKSYTPLIYAVQYGHIDIANLLLERNVDPNVCDNNKRTPLSHAAQRRHIDIVKLLLEKNADPNICDKDQYTPLSYAAQRDRMGIVKLLLERNADPNVYNKDQRTLLSYAAQWGRIDIVNLLLEKNADPKACDKDQRTVLSYAAEEGHIDIVKLLLERNVDPDTRDKEQHTSLSYAAQQGHMDVVKLLLERNADPDICDKDQHTPLFHAAQRGHIEIVQLLVKYSDSTSIKKVLSFIFQLIHNKYHIVGGNLRTIQR
ncbi:hypothetical protein C8J56DRAFT_1160444 [Mycena floridula]|nr:hypothetical protein C8J56DRAFT_1160444 [Mycena floridula]